MPASKHIITLNAVNMPKLNAQELQFIDNYLKNSGVVYADIRFEMTDHVATALEAMDGDFYENVHLYMARHKKELMQANHRFGKIARNRAVKMLFANMLKPFPLIVMALMVFTLSTAKIDLEMAETLAQVLTLIPFLVILFIDLFRGNNKNRLSVTDKLFTSLAVISYLLLMVIPPDRLFGNVYVSCIYYTLLFLFIWVNLYTWCRLKHKYRKTYRID